MTTWTPRRTGWITLGSLILALSAAQAQVRPEITLLIDAPRRSQLTLEGLEPNCLDPAANAPGPLDPVLAEVNRPRIQIIKDVLAGRSQTPYWCRGYSVEWQLANAGSLRYPVDQLGSSYRSMCCAQRNGNLCQLWAPCGNDHGSALDNADDATPLGYGADGAFLDDGLLSFYSQQNRHLRFGLLVSETGVDQFPLSFGGENINAGAAAAVAGNATRYGLGLRPDGMGGLVPVGRGQAGINVGVRDDADRFGRRQPGSRGYLDGDLACTGNNCILTETGAMVSAHNSLIARQIREIVPHGHTHLAAMLFDTLNHFQRVDGGQGEELVDGAALCRWRAVVLISDGADTPLYGGEPCNIGPGNAPVPESAQCNGGGGTCMLLPTLDDALAEKLCAVNPCEGAGEVCLPRDPANPESVRVCQVPACRYPDGFPYARPETYAQQLLEQGVQVFTVAFGASPDGLARLQRIAAAGSPGAGRLGGDGWYVASNEAELREALVRIANGAFAERVPAGAPVAAVPSVGDLFDDGLQGKDIRQIRQFAFTESGAAGDAAAYGRIQQQVLGCEGDPAPGERAIKILSDRRLDLRYVDQAQVRTVSRDPFDQQVRTITGGGAPMFLPDGPPADQQNDAISFTQSVDPEVLKSVGALFHGYFGDVGRLSDGGLGERQLGAVKDGDRVLVSAPALGVPLPSYEEFYQGQRTRPSFLVTGAQDGKIHIFRADTGAEVVGFVPRLSWNGVAGGGFPADGPLSAREMVACRALGEGREGCPAELTNASFRTLLVGGTGAGGANLWGLDLTRLADLVAEDPGAFTAGNSFSEAGRDLVWDVTSEGNANFVIPGLGRAVSRPVLAHVRVGDEIRAAAIAGCGDDTDPVQATQPNLGGTGRCVLILDATTGEPLSAPLVADTMVYPMVGAPAVFPAGGTAPIERIYLGDRHGNLFRVDLRSNQPAQWRVERAWPPPQYLADSPVTDGEFLTGKAATGAPAVATAEDGNVVVVYGQGEDGEGRAHVVSFTDRAVFLNGEVNFQVLGNWILPLRPDEVMVSEPEIVDGVVFTTTTEQSTGEAQCLPSSSRVYAMHYRDITVNDEGAKQTYTRADDEAALYVKPQLPRFEADGTPAEPALSLVLPPGVKAYGMTIVRTPSCREEEGPTTDLILSAGADDSGGAGAGQAVGGVARQKIEYRDGGQLQSVGYDRSVFVESSAVGLQVCLNCDRDGRAVQGFAAGRFSPFPSQLIFWGSTFAE